MIELFLSLALQTELGRLADGCPDPDHVFGRVLLEAGESCARLDAEKKAELEAEKLRERRVARFQPRLLPPAIRTQIQRKLSIRALDGPALRFIWPTQQHPFVYCGFINGKNRMGAWTGYLTFIAGINDDGTLDEVLIDEPTRCEEYGYNSDPAS